MKTLFLRKNALVLTLGLGILSFFCIFHLTAKPLAMAQEAPVEQEADEEEGENADVMLMNVIREIERRYDVTIRLTPWLGKGKLFEPELEIVAMPPAGLTLEEALYQTLTLHGLVYEKKADHYWVTGGKTPGVYLLEKRYSLPREAADDILDILPRLICEDSWRSNGGAGVCEFDKKTKTLTVWQSPDVMPLVDDFFAKLMGTYVPSPGREKLLRVLETPTTLAFPETPLREIAKLLETKYGVPIRLDMEKLEDCGVSADEPFSADYRDIAMGSILRNMFFEKHLGYVPDGDTLVITSREKADNTHELRLYPWKFEPTDCVLLIQAPDGEMVTLWEMQPEHATKENTPVTEVYDGPVESEPTAEWDSLYWLLEGMVQKDTWECNGGAAKLFFMGVPKPDTEEIFAVVNGSQRLHEDVKRLLDAVTKKTPWRTPAELRALAALEKPVSVTAIEEGMTIAEFVGEIGRQIGEKIYCTEDILYELEESSAVKGRIYPNVVSVSARTALRGVIMQDTDISLRNETLWLTKNDEALYPVFYPLTLNPGDDLESIMELVVNCINKDSWEDNGGSAVIARPPQRDGIIVLQSPATHREIARLLQTYHEKTPPRGAIEKHFQDLLATKVSLAYVDKTMREVMADLQGKFGITIRPNWKAMRENVVNLDEIRVTLEVTDISLRNAMELLCRQSDQIGLAVTDEEVVVLPRGNYKGEFADNYMFAKMYPWKFPPERFLEGDRYSVGRSMSGRLFGAGGTGGIMGGFFLESPAPSEAEDAGMPAPDRWELLDILTLIDADSWEVNGGPGTAGWLSEWIVVTQTEAVHREVEKLLRALRRKPPLQTATEMRIAKCMKQPVTWDFHARPLGEVALELSRQVGVNFVPDAGAMMDEVSAYEESGREKEISPKTPVTARVENVPLERALNEMLHPLGLRWLVQNDVVLLTTPRVAYRSVAYRVYDVTGAGRLDMTSGDVKEMLEERLTFLHDGRGEHPLMGECGPFFLVVAQTPTVHAMIAGLLKNLEAELPSDTDRREFWQWQDDKREALESQRFVPFRPVSRSRRNDYLGGGFM